MRESGRSRSRSRSRSREHVASVASVVVAIAVLVGGCGVTGTSPSPSPTLHPTTSPTRAASPSPTSITHGVFAAACSMKTAHGNAVLLHDGRVLMGSWPDSFGRAIAATEIFDPKTGLYSAGPVM